MNSIDKRAVNVGAIGHMYDGVTKLAKFIAAAFGGGQSEVVESADNVSYITDPYRVNRIVRSKYRLGDYVIVHPVLHHYAFTIDGHTVVMGIVEVVDAIESLERHERRQYAIEEE